MIKKIVLIVTGLAVTVFAVVFGYQKLRIKTIKPEIENGFYPIDLNGTEATETPFASVPF